MWRFILRFDGGNNGMTHKDEPTKEELLKALEEAQDTVAFYRGIIKKLVNK